MPYQEKYYHERNFQLLAISQQLSRIYSNYALSRGITATELMFFYELHTEEQCTPKSIADKWSLPKQTVNNIIRQQERLNHLSLLPHPSDARSKQIELTQKGASFISELIAPLIQAEIKALRRIEPSRIDEAIALEKLYNEYLTQEIETDASPLT